MSSSNPLTILKTNGPFGVLSWEAIRTIQNARKKCAPEPLNKGPTVAETTKDKTKYTAVNIVAYAMSLTREVCILDKLENNSVIKLFNIVFKQSP